MDDVMTRLSGIAALLLAACAGGSMPCRVGAECESGVCLADGRCAPLDAGGATDAGVQPDDAHVARDDAGTDAGAIGDSGAIDDAGPPGCGNGDGRIEASELPIDLGAILRTRAALRVAVDSHGVERPDGTRLWDLEGPFEGDADRSFRRGAIEGAWFASSFPGASYSLPLSTDADLLGVFERTESSVLLRGVVSPEDGLSRTELTYDPPATVWRFPLEVGASFESTSTVSGVASGVGALYTERWQVSVDARGAIGTPAGVREVLRVSTLLTRTVGLSVTQHRRLAFVEECRGTVAQIFGADGVAAEEPAYASELWRLAL